MKNIGWLVLAMIVGALCTPSIAHADCIVGARPGGNSKLQSLVMPTRTAVSPSVAVAAGDNNASIVGMWTVTFLVGNGPDVYDKGFEQWHSDGTEFTIDVAVPPAAGNVCMGVWVPTGPRSVKLHHLGWNWDTSVTPAALAGVFVLDMTATVDRNNNTFRGTYATDSYDNNGNILPAFHGEGVVTGQRVRVQ